MGAHRFLPEEAAKLSAGDDVLGKVSLPWLNLVAGSNSCEFTWTHLVGITRLKGNRQVVHDGTTNGVIATPQVSEGGKMLEVRVINPGTNKYFLIGWGPSD